MKKFILACRKVINGFLFVETVIPRIGMLMLMLLIAYESLSRYIFSYTPLGIEEFTIIVGSYTFYLGSALSSRYGTQIRVTIVDSISLPANVRRTINVAMSFLSSLICVAILFYAFEFFNFTVDRNINIVPMMWPYSLHAFSIVIALALMALHDSWRGVGRLRRT